MVATARIAAEQGSLIIFARWRLCVPLLNTWFIGLTRVCPSNGISIDLAVFAVSTVVINTQSCIDQLRQHIE